MKTLIACIIAPVLMLFFRVEIESNDAQSILSLLVAIAGAVFTIMSIWVAFLYPNVLKTLKGENLVNADFSASGEYTSRLKEIISVIVQSATTMVVAIILLILISSGGGFSFSTQAWIASICQFSLLFVSVLQVSALVSTIRINLSFMDVLDRQRGKRAQDWDT